MYNEQEQHPSQEVIQGHSFAEWVMMAHKDAAAACVELEAVATRYEALDTKMAGAAGIGGATGQHDVTVRGTIAHLRLFLAITLGRAAAAQHSKQEPAVFRACGCTVRKEELED